MADLAVDLCGLTLANPLVLASGIWGSGAGTLVRLAEAGAGAVTSKSCGVAPRAGHPNPTVLPWSCGLINAVGLSNPGAEAQAEMLTMARTQLQPLGVPLIASVFGHTLDEFARVVAVIETAEPDLVELNISCPNVEAEFGRPFALDPEAAARVVARVRSLCRRPMLVKLSPNTPDLVQVAEAVVAEGADGLTAVNTLGPGMIIDTRARRPVLSNRVGGVSGAALRPIAVRCVHDLAAAVPVPIVGTGGVASGDDALQMIMAGATAVGVGSALHTLGDDTFRRIRTEMETWLEKEGVQSLDEIRGCAHV
jgi:dihydroorotate dehydrogenase (NAD+) catalytic subunit